MGLYVKWICVLVVPIISFSMLFGVFTTKNCASAPVGFASLWVSGFRRDAVEVSVLPGWNVALRHRWLEADVSIRCNGLRFDTVQWSHIEESKSPMKNQHWTFRPRKLRSSRCLETGGTNQPVTRHHIPAQKDGDRHLVCLSVNM